MIINRLNARVKFMIFDGDDHLLGPGGYRLLKAIHETGSVKRATESLNMSYSKGWKILNGLEDQMQFELVHRNQGGPDGGRSALTEEALALIEIYAKVLQEVEHYANQVLAIHLETLLK